jgi:hypothetical protein
MRVDSSLFSKNYDIIVISTLGGNTETAGIY